MKFSDNLRMLRAKYKLSQQDIGDIVGLTGGAVSRWENELTQPDNDSLIKLAKYFNVSTDYLLGIEKNKEEIDPLDDILFSKAKDLSDEDKKAVLGIINALKKDIDKELDK
ncbi:MAG TPA: helix-turn-helix transcriptional regulator [Candidatus Aphodocola excrementigallinarum]|uniref:Helix-turn-helix transcriptional regulator n=1 Tax=Candidatus Aphodocola excrementigallinarum TaxID=2840670 RepID=A0A9D1IM11_9FIRM|nr:helix-turn-helix transcriptional regulator [Candidatus Aphodocola excrementigallinarum]